MDGWGKAFVKGIETEPQRTSKRIGRDWRGDKRGVEMLWERDRINGREM